METSPPRPPQQHFLFVTNPMQGHVNPARRLAARVAACNPDARITFSTAISGHRRMFPSLARPDDEAVDAAGVLHVPFSDGFDDGFDSAVHGTGTYRSRATAAGRETLSAVASRFAARGLPVTCFVYTFLVPWVPDVARAHGAHAALFWIQPAAVFAVYYRYFHGHDAALAACANGADDGAPVVSLPGLPPLGPDALPSIVSITSPEHRHYLVLDLLRDLFLSLDEHRSRVLVNTFDALEHDALRAVPELEVAAVGPVVPGDASPSSAVLLLRHDATAAAYMEWLDAKPARSVVYVSFGTILSLSKRQEEEMRQGLEATGRPYLWVARKPSADGGASPDSGGGGANGLVVEWCDQVRVLSHAAVGCFVTHCGWNSTLESVASGVPMVCVPQWTDQPTVAWLVEARAGAGVRARVDGEGVVERGELRRCVEAVMGGGEGAPAIRAQSDRWRELATEAVAPGGTSERNLRAFASAAAGRLPTTDAWSIRDSTDPTQGSPVAPTRPK